MSVTHHLKTAVLISMLLFAALAIAGDEEVDKNFSSLVVEINHGRLSLQVKNTTIKDVLEAVARKAGFRVQFLGDFQGLAGSWFFSDIPLSKGIRQLAGDNSTVIIYDSRVGKDQTPTINTLYIYANKPTVIADPRPVQPTQITPSNQATTAPDLTSTPAQQMEVDRLIGLTGADTIDSLRAELHSSHVPSVRKRAAIMLKDIGGIEASDALEAGLGDDDPAIRIAAVSYLGQLGGDKAIMAIGQTIIADPDPATRHAAVLALSSHEGGAVDAFLKAAKMDNAKRVRDAATMLLNQ